MMIESNLLIGFCAIMDNRSVTRAATILGLTQPAVSAKLNRLETELGFKLFTREGGRLRPTHEGREFYQMARQALAMLERVGIAAERIRTGETGKIVVAAHPSASISLLPEVIAAFSNTFPQIDLKLINRTSEEVRSVFEASIVDIAIAEVPVDLAGVAKIRYEIDCVAILPSGHPAAAKDILGPQDLSGLPFVSMTLGRTIGHQIKSAIVDAGADFRKVMEAEYFSTICGLVANGLGVSIVDYWSAQTFRHMGLEIRPFQPPIKYEIVVFYSSERELSPPARMLLHMINTKLTQQGRLLNKNQKTD
jgi:DNA-binding transcriptional LysR family regulator